MKREYSKPTIHVEVISLDMPIAQSCDSFSDFPELEAQGWFVNGKDSGCAFELGNSSGSGIFKPGDTLCFHSNVSNPFYS